MRIHPVALIPVVLLAACARRDLAVTPDRQGHALVIAADGTLLGSDDSPAAAASGGPAAPAEPRADERVVVLEPGQELWQLTDAEGEPLYPVIRRNDFVSRPQAGDEVILPAR